MANITIDEVNLEEIDSLLLPGCMDISTIMNEEKLINFIKQVATKRCIIASISSSPLLLAKAGVLEGKKYTVGLTEEAIICSNIFEEANLSNELVVQDGNIITARGRGFVRFGKYLGKALNLSFDEGWYKEESV
jgi:protein deglycase